MTVCLHLLLLLWSMQITSGIVIKPAGEEQVKTWQFRGVIWQEDDMNFGKKHTKFQLGKIPQPGNTLTEQS